MIAYRTGNDLELDAVIDSDLAVRRSHQRQGIGRELVRRTREAAPRATLVLLAAPAAETYYPHIGFEHHPQAWILRGGPS